MFKAIIFDLDGTLLNTLDDLADSVNEMLTNHGFPVHPVSAYKYFVGNGAETMVKRALPDKISDDIQIKELAKECKSIYNSRMLIKTKPYEGIIDLLKELNKHSIPINILSNKPHKETLKIVKELFKDINIKIIKGAHNKIPIKPDPTQALLISKELNISPDLFLYVGDTDVDMKTAKNAGMFGVGVLWGFREKKELEENGAKVLINHPSELLKLILF